MGLKKSRVGIRTDEEADIGIGTLIIFIAIVLVAAIAASLILYAAALLQQQAQKTVDEAVNEVSGGLEVINIAGDRNPDGKDSTIVSGYMPPKDTQAPTGGTLQNVTASNNGISPLRIVLNWTSAVDYGSGLSEEIVYRTSVYDPTNPDTFNEQIARNRLVTLSQLSSSMELVRLNEGFGTVQYIDYTVRDDLSTSYAYAIVGVDRAGNHILYSALDSSATTDDTTVEEDLTPPAGGSMTSTAKPDEYSVTLFWVPGADAGSGLLKQYLYRSEVPISTPATTTVDGRTVLVLPTATLLDELNATVSSYVDSAPEVGTYYYFVVTEDRSGNQAYLGSLQFTFTQADTSPPEPVSELGTHQYALSVGLSWASGSDAQTSVKEYRIYRATAVSSIDSVEELMTATPLAVLEPDATNYSDYSGDVGRLYYYTVVTVDGAGNYARPVVATNTIQMIEIKVATVPGSDPILFSALAIEITDNEKDVTLMFNAGVYGPQGADGLYFSVDILRDPEDAFATTLSLSSGGLVKIFINAGKIGLNLHAQASFSMKFIPSIGQESYEDCSIPYLASYRYINLV